ncbi:hypothetical protein C922_05430 [Plasmodium inui San Antonio 1]|uniref:Uncharacterized protein n=1 Tax=Plasmodium inui San Antonio 1 TaxID=1237626 RepID=W6ZXZ3_9APIC|nr:hypothetical protein C922_05430 [Plasmodium inui San Antonio 1]EUD64193.1 hypothetical protein C922_05430 [Plasmodium inui San Antonio 1]
MNPEKFDVSAPSGINNQLDWGGRVRLVNKTKEHVSILESPQNCKGKCQIRGYLNPAFNSTQGSSVLGHNTSTLNKQPP